ncbi:MAG: response regulator, partial [Synechococcaceae cyanobacterium SM2_3_1]|nr:response regulator [Synechococcaceae cyanobacterium SM2_3_1]
LLDLMMPVVNGYEICAQIRRVSGLKSVPVVILTSNDGVVDRVRAKMVDSTDFLAKPVDPKKLLETMQRHLPG